MNDNKTSNSGHRKRLRDRYLSVGIDGFSPKEVLALILNNAIKRADTKSIADNLLIKFGDINSTLNAPVEELIKIDGIGKESAIAIKLFKDVSVFLAKEKVIHKECVTSINEVIEYLNSYFKGKHYEEFVVIFLNNSNQILRIDSVSQGTVNEAKVYVRNIVKSCLEFNSTGIILVHNHPGGSLKASQSDIDITLKIKTACSYFNIRVLDHFIITYDGYLSFAGENLI